MDRDRGIIKYSCPVILPDLSIRSFDQLIFGAVPYRRSDSEILISHIGDELVSLSLGQLRSVVRKVYWRVHMLRLSPGDTVLLCRMEGSSELNIALLLFALSAYGIRVFLPMYLEPDHLSDWLDLADVKCVVLPEIEIAQCESHHREKEQLTEIKQIAAELSIPVVDVLDQSENGGLLADLFDTDQGKTDFPPGIAGLDSIEREALIVTTSGTSGRSKLVVYTQGAILNSCLSWETAGFFSPELMGGRSFTPLITHTMGIRGLFNALWSGYPVCLINTNYYTEKPEVSRFFLMEMKPHNITGGPALYQLLLEMIRLFPELRDGLRENIRTLVSSGTSFNPKTVQFIEDVFDKSMHNAFGTTETQQVTNTLLSEKKNRDSDSLLGGLLPGVEIELRPVEDDPDNFSLHVFAPFMHKHVLGEHKTDHMKTDRFFATKDLVRPYPAGQIEYIGRKSDDFLKDGFGVKIPLGYIREYYKSLIEKFEFVHFIPVNAYPGMAVLIFKPDSQRTSGEKTSIKHLIRDINSGLKKQLTPFEYNHRHICAFHIIQESVPLTTKGNVSISNLERNYAHELSILENLFDRQLEVCMVDDEEPDIDLYSEFSNPYLGNMTRALKANWNFHRGRGDELFCYRDGQEVAVIDFVGGYGSGLLGHNNPDIIKSVTSFLNQEAVPLSDQFSSHEVLGSLARNLENELSKIQKARFVSLFGSTGSEIVEMALHHAYLEWTREIRKIKDEQFRQFADVSGEQVRGIWEENWDNLMKQRVLVVSHKDGYHGLSSGARSVLGEGKRRKPFKALLPIDSIHIDDLADDWKTVVEKDVSAAVYEIKLLRMVSQEVIVEKFTVSLVIASIFEPIIGEGGVRELEPGVLEYFAEQPYPLIIDEIQTGLGRTGEFLASEKVKGDYYLLSKSLGGNVHKISTLLIRRNRFVAKIHKHYISTFSMGALAAQTAQATLAIIKRDRIPELARSKGNYLMKGLLDLKNRFPSLICRVGGRGLMCGLQMSDMSDLDTSLIKALYKHEVLGYLCSAYLLNVHHIRVLPTLSAPDTLRFEPSAYISDQQIDRLLEALGAFFHLLDNKDSYNLLRFLMDGDTYTDNRGYEPEQGFVDVAYDIPAKGARQIASIVHFAYPTEELRMIDKSLTQASDTGLRLLFRRFQAVLGGKTFLLSSKNIHRGAIHLKVYLLIADSAELESLQKQGHRNKITGSIQKAVDMAAREGAEVISLGGFTSIVTRNGTQIVKPSTARVITGNSLTAGMGIRRMCKEIEDYSSHNEDVKIALIGATGNIGSLIGRELLMDEKYSKLVLISRRKVSLDQIIRRYRLPEASHYDLRKLNVSTKLADIFDCNFIVAVSNSSDPIIFPRHIRRDCQVFIFDVSIPSAVSSEVRHMENVNIIPFTAYALLPHDPDFVISSCIPPGTIFCCMAEGLLCALEDVNFSLTGRIDPAAVDFLIKIAEKHGLVAGLEFAKSFKNTK